MNAKTWDVYADKYYENIVSPLQPTVQNPLWKYLKKVSRKQQKIVVDAGCGIGDLTKIFARQFKKVIAVDFSEKMLQQARKRNITAKNISFHRCDLRKLSTVVKKADVIVAVNSLLLPNFSDIRLEFSQIHKSLKSGGDFFAIVPAVEANLHYFQLVYERELTKTKNPKVALAKTKKIVDFTDYNFITSTYTAGSESQILYTKQFLHDVCEKSGFKDIVIEKVLYPWGEASGDYESFPDKPQMWDWFVSAKK